MLSRWILAAGTVLGLSACQSGTTEKQDDKPASATASYRADISRLCNVMHLSGADELAPEERVYTTANWLGNNLETQQGRDFLVTFTQAQDKDKPQTLLAEAKRVGVTPCPLADHWQRQP
jgi:hypothetical protein